MHSETFSTIVYETVSPVLFSQLMDGKFEKVWRTWMPRHLEVRSDGTLIYRQTKDTVAKNTLDIKIVTITYIPASFEEEDNSSSLLEEIGFHVACKEGTLATEFKCVMPLSELEGFCAAIRQVSLEHNVDGFLSSLGDYETRRQVVSGGAATSGNPLRNRKKSVMRRSIAHAVDEHTKKTKTEKILARLASPTEKLHF